MIARGDLVEVGGMLAVVIRVHGDDGVPEDHAMLWFGEPPTTRLSEGGVKGSVPIVYTVPVELCLPAAAPSVRH